VFDAFAFYVSLRAFLIRILGAESNTPTCSAMRGRIQEYSQLIWPKRQVPHLIVRGHMPGHSLDRLLRDWMISGGTVLSFCPDLRTEKQKLISLNAIVI
jgi:hypothetical protein